MIVPRRRVNQHEKRDRLPADDLLRRAADPIQDWWRQAYLAGPNLLLPRRFVDEARASLSGLGSITEAASGEVFAALRVRHSRLRHDQQVPEWTGLSAQISRG
jgi:hypothetical protein